jgi:DNA-directed RNA polymerase specialized sigma subunit
MAKYDSNTKRKRNQEIVWLREFQPELSLKEIAARYSISTQRVHQIIHKAEKNGKK